MADITMCNNAAHCPKKACCWRHLAVPSKWQSWQDFYVPGEDCQHFKERAPQEDTCIGSR